LFSNDLRPPALLGIFNRPAFKVAATAKKFLRTNGKFPRCALTKANYVGLEKFPVYDLITKSSRQQAEVYEIARIITLASLDKGNPSTEYIRC
jgi:hypothetical protein